MYAIRSYYAGSWGGARPPFSPRLGNGVRSPDATGPGCGPSTRSPARQHPTQMTKAVRWPFLVGGALLAILAGLVFGATFNGPSALIEGIGSPDSMARTILIEVRLPRVVLAFMVGGGLGIAGAALQALVRSYNFV